MGPVIYVVTERKSPLDVAIQVQACRSYLHTLRSEEMQVFIDEAAMRTPHGLRPAFSEMLSGLRGKKFNTVVIAAIERLAGSAQEVRRLVELLQDCNATVLSAATYSEIFMTRPGDLGQSRLENAKMMSSDQMPSRQDILNQLYKAHLEEDVEECNRVDRRWAR